MTVEPARVLQAWLGDGGIPETVVALEADGACWRLVLERGVTSDADLVVIAAGFASNGLAPELALGAVRGQASWVAGSSSPTAVLGGAYAIPTADGVMFGATHDRGDTAVDEREADHGRNLEALKALLPRLADSLAAATPRAHVGTRATTKDFMPLAGALRDAGPALLVLTGLGSRGYCLAPLLAEHVAALAVGVPSPLPHALSDLVDPARFARREARVAGPTALKPPASRKQTLLGAFAHVRRGRVGT